MANVWYCYSMLHETHWAFLKINLKMTSAKFAFIAQSFGASFAQCLSFFSACSKPIQVYLKHFWGLFEDPAILCISGDGGCSSCFWEEEADLEASMDTIGEKGETTDEDAAMLDAELVHHGSCASGVASCCRWSYARYDVPDAASAFYSSLLFICLLFRSLRGDSSRRRGLASSSSSWMSIGVLFPNLSSPVESSSRWGCLDEHKVFCLMPWSLLS